MLPQELSMNTEIVLQPGPEFMVALWSVHIRYNCSGFEEGVYTRKVDYQKVLAQ